MNARALAAWSASGLAAALASNNPAYRALVVLCALNVLLSLLPSGRSPKPILLAALFASSVAVLLNPLLSHTGVHVLVSLPSWLPGVGGPVTLESAAYGVSAGLGVAAAILCVAPLSLCLEPEDLVDALPRPLERTGAALAAGLNLVPAIGRAFVAVSEAQRMRGWRPRGPRSWGEVAVPVMLTAIEDSLQLAEAMEARAFGSGPRTRYRSLAFSGRDWAVVGAAVVVGAVFLGARVAGALPDWEPYPSLAAPAVSPWLAGCCLLLLAPLLPARAPRPGRGPAGAGAVPATVSALADGGVHARGDGRLEGPALALLSLAGLLLFVWPFLGSPMGGGPALGVALALVAGLVLVEAGTRRLDSRGLALLAALAAIDAGFRLALITGIGGFSPIFLPILCAGYVLGPSFGFLVGALGLLVSGVASGGVGPWLPYQMLACGWVGVAAGLVAGRGLVALAAVGVVGGFAFGALMDMWDWTAFYAGAPGLGWSPGLAPGEALGRFSRFYAVTSAWYDAFRAAGNLLMVWLLAPPLVAALERVGRRLSFELGPAAIIRADA